jgi:hypothetical protein
MTGRLIRHELCADEWSEVAKALERDGETTIVGSIVGAIPNHSEESDSIRMYFDDDDTAKIERTIEELGIS